MPQQPKNGFALPPHIPALTLLAAALLLSLLSACSAPKPARDPVLALNDPEVSGSVRLEAADAAWDEVDQGLRDRRVVREALKQAAWDSANGAGTRLAMIDALLRDTTEEGREDTIRMARLMLATEQDASMARGLALLAGENRWTELTPALIRRLANIEDADIAFQDRTELIVLRKIHDPQPVASVAFEVFLDPVIEAGKYSDEWTEQTRLAAWEVVGRLDEPSELVAYLERAELDDLDPRTAATIRALRAAWSDLSTAPQTSMELAWLMRLFENAENQQWWDETTAAVQSIPVARRGDLAMRHLEAIRWAKANRPAWTTAPRAALLAQIESRLEPRRHTRRTKDERSLSRQRELFSENRDMLSWADALALLVADETLSDPAFASRVFQIVQIDQNDETTEYGGTVDAAGGAIYRPVLFAPRARDRISDEAFVASIDMINQSDRALAHFHLQVQKNSNGTYAGPSFQDLAYVRRSGRTGLVFTSISRDVLNVDYYTPQGAIVDLGGLAADGSRR